VNEKINISGKLKEENKAGEEMDYVCVCVGGSGLYIIGMVFLIIISVSRMLGVWGSVNQDTWKCLE
jgi:hypothetical protein